MLVTVLALLMIVLAPPGISGSTTPRAENNCLPPTIQDNNVNVLSTPMNQTFRAYRIIESPSQAGRLNYSWIRVNGSLDHRRTTITHTGSDDHLNVSIAIRKMQERDEGTYVLEAANQCGEKNYTVMVLVKHRGCHDYEMPNATHIQRHNKQVIEGDTIELSCSFNGDISPLYWDVQWDKNSERDVMIVGPPKYSSSSVGSCPSGAPCCSFVNYLFVHNATLNDSATYRCLAWAVDSGLPPYNGTTLSVYIAVAPLPEILEQPQSADVAEGKRVELSCTVRGFPNVTIIQWTRDSKNISSNSGGYTTTRQMVNGSQVVFMETLRFTAHPSSAGRYACCVGVREDGVEVRRVTPQEEYECGEPGTVRVNTEDQLHHIEVIAGTGGGVLVIVVVIATVVIVWKRAAVKKQRGYQLIGGKEEAAKPINYGATEYIEPLANPVRLTSSVAQKEGQVYIIYGLELNKYSSIEHEDYPAYEIITDFIHLLQMLGISCHHDAVESITGSQDFCSRVEESVQEAKIVIVVCSEVLHTAFAETSENALVQMKFGMFNAQRILKLIVQSPMKFIPVVLAGGGEFCNELPSQRGYNLHSFHLFLQELEGNFSEEKIAEVLEREEFIELWEFVQACMQ